MAGDQSWREEPCLPGCVSEHVDDLVSGVKCCRTCAGTVWVNTLVPHPRPEPLSVGALQAVGPPDDRDLDEGPRLYLQRGDTEGDVLTTEAGRELAWVLLAAADALDRRC